MSLHFVNNCKFRHPYLHQKHHYFCYFFSKIDRIENYLHQICTKNEATQTYKAR